MPKALLLDEDKGCLDFYHGALTRAGFSTISVSSGSDAAAQFMMTPDFDVLVVDVTHADGESGVAAAQQIRRLCPDIRVLFVSGWLLEQAISMGFIDPAAWSDDHTAFLPKPFTFQVFLDTVGGLLDGSGVSLAAAAVA